MKIRVLVVDDSPFARNTIAQGLSADPALIVVGTASDPYEARDKIVELTPDVMTLDVEMPRMNGVDFLRKLMPKYPLPVVMVSGFTKHACNVTLAALEAGAVDYVFKPESPAELEKVMVELRTKVKVASVAQVHHHKLKRELPSQKKSHGGTPASLTVAIGASTGGTEALRTVLEKLPADFPAVVVVQHMPPTFTELFANHLDQVCAMHVKEAKDGDAVNPGQVLIAPGGQHLEVFRRHGQLIARLLDSKTVNGHRPSADVLFHSVAKHCAADALGVILTGMGNDGAQGLLAMFRAGAYTYGQDEASCVVYGMPRVAREIGALSVVLPLDGIGPALVKRVWSQETCRSY